MIYLLLDQERKQNAINHILTLSEGDKWEVVIQEYVKKRSAAQNRLYHMWKPFIARASGYTLDEMHDELKYAFIGEETYTNRKGIERKRPKSSKKLKVAEFVNFLTKIEILADKLKVTLPKPHDYEFAMMRE